MYGCHSDITACLNDACKPETKKERYTGWGLKIREEYSPMCEQKARNKGTLSATKINQSVLYLSSNANLLCSSDTQVTKNDIN